MGVLSFAVALLAHVCSASCGQAPLSTASGGFDDHYYHFSHEIRRVAVIGAGPAGLQSAAALLENGFEVRLFERSDNPGGNWYYREDTPIHASFPNKPIVNLSYTPDIPSRLPYTCIYADGDDGLTNSWRLREHENPSPVWKSLTILIPPFAMTLPNIKYPPDTPWKAPNINIQRHVRQYASSIGINSNDEENVNATSYSTRVERMHKPSGGNRWILTLRKLERVPYSHGKLRARWWTEEFDAVVVAAGSYDAAWVPNIPNLNNVLIVGGSTSACGIAADLIRVAASVTLSIRHHPPDASNPLARAIASLLPHNVSIIPEISRFPNTTVPPHRSDIRGLSLVLANGTIVSGYDHIILATGYRRSKPFLSDYHNSTIKGFDNPDTKVAPIVTDGTHHRSLHWTGHYIDDPTLALMHLTPWTLGYYQALGIARSWAEKARLPSIRRMWETNPGPGRELPALLGHEEQYSRLFINWLNHEALEFGGRLVQPLSRNYNALHYYASSQYGDVFPLEWLLEQDQIPRSQWPARNETTLLRSLALDDDSWADWNPWW